jgi:TonB-linked SusC/RagA family outer membrane protein
MAWKASWLAPVARVVVGALAVAALTTAGARTALAQQTPPAAQGERTTITGTVKDAATGAPIPGVNVAVYGTPRAAVTNDQGVYTIVNVPTGNTVALEARRLGYSASRKDNVRVTGSTMTVDLILNSNPLMLESITAAATVDPTSGVKTPYMTAKLDVEQMPVPALGSASTMLAGKLSGVQVNRTSGEPGAGAVVQLRSAISPFHNNTPLYVIDGVPLSDASFLGNTTSTMDFESMNIASIEVIKGAAAAALYGSRGANGVIDIKTNRGRNVQFGKSEFTYKTQYSMDQYSDKLQKIKHHNWRTNALGQWIDANGVVVPRAQRTVDPDGMIDNSFTSFYDNVGQVFRPGRTFVNSLGLSQASAATNLNITFDRNEQSGLNIEAKPFVRNNFRAAVDHNFRDNLSFGISATHSRTTRNPDQLSYSNLFRFDPDVDLLQNNTDGSPYRVFPDSAASTTNPLYLQHYRERQERRVRSLISTNANFRPTNWLSLTGDFGYDRNDRIVDNYTPPGLPTDNNGSLSTGSLSYQENEGDSYNGSLGATFLQNFGGLTARWTTKGEVSNEKALTFTATGTDFAFTGLKDMAAAVNRTIASGTSEIRTQSGYTALGLDYNSKYVLDVLGRREGSSLFGPEERWKNYYRVAGSYIVSSEEWFQRLPAFLTNFSTVKGRYSVGTAGNRPNFADQYPVLAARTQGLIRDDLGNPFITPEVKTEQEAGLDLIYKQRLSLILNWSRATVSNTLVQVAVPSATGFNTATQNVGKSRGETWESTLEGAWINRRNLRWSTNLVLDRSTERQIEYNRPCYIDNSRWRCDNVPLSTIWGSKHAHDLADLPQDATTQGVASEFQVNDEGYLVWVGSGNTWADGMRKNLWGTSKVINGVTYRWGEPFVRPIPVGSPEVELIGDGQPKLNFGFGNTVTYKGVRFYGLFRGRIHGDIYNNLRQTLTASNDWYEMDQTGRPDSLKKTANYYARGIADNNNDFNDAFVEDGTYLKFSEFNIDYTFQNANRFVRRLGAQRVNIALIGRDLATWSKFKGLDPENGTIFGNTSIVDAAYPVSRNFTLSLGFVF